MGEGIPLHMEANVFVPIPLSIYIYLKTMMQDLPLDPTGELDELRHFIEDNINLSKWIGIVVISTQVDLMATNHLPL